MESRPRAFMKNSEIIELLQLGATKLPMLNIPVSYKKR
jgi:hypothetical protein